MSHRQLGLVSPDDAEKATLSPELPGRDADRRPAPLRAVERDWRAAADREQIEREIAAIERASAALRRADPTMESWVDVPAPAPKHRPIWVLIGALWLWTALMTTGAFFAASALIG